jgi:hypothetical protein
MITTRSDAISDTNTVTIGIIVDQRPFMANETSIDIGDMRAANRSCATTPGAMVIHEIGEKWAKQSFGQPQDQAHRYGTAIENRIAPWQRPIGGEQVIGPKYVNGREVFEVHAPYYNSGKRETVVFTIINGKVVSVKP